MTEISMLSFRNRQAAQGKDDGVQYTRILYNLRPASLFGLFEILKPLQRVNQ